MDKQNLINDSKKISWFLRHGGKDQLDSTGFISLENLSLNIGLTVERIMYVYDNGGKSRFELKEDLIRAMQGHSIENLNLIDNETFTELTLDILSMYKI